MTTIVEARPVTTARATVSEWVKFRSLRSSWAVLGAAVLGMFVIGLLVAYNTRHLSPILQADDLAPSATLQGHLLAQLLVGALGVLFVSGEYTTGMIRSTMAAVPKRVPVLAAKLTVYAGLILTTMTLSSLGAFLLSQAFLSRYRTGWSLTDPGAARVVLATAAYLTLVAILGSAVGWIVRNTAGALVTFFGLILVLPVVFGTVLGSWGQSVAKYLPSEAGGAFVNSVPDSPHLSAWTGFGVLLGWVALALVIAIWSLRSRDS